MRIRGPLSAFALKPPGFLAENVDVCFGVFAILVGLGLTVGVDIFAAKVMGIGFLAVGIALLIKERKFLKDVIDRSERKNVLITIGICIGIAGILSSVIFESGSAGQKIGFGVMAAGVVVILSSEILRGG